MENLLQVAEQSDLTPAQATMALVKTTAEIKKVTEMAKKDPEKIKKEIDALGNTDKGKNLQKFFNAREVGKLLETAATDPKGKAAVMDFLKSFMELDATCHSRKTTK